MTFESARRWLLVMASLVAAFGIGLALVPLGVDVVFRLLIYGSGWPEGFGPEAREYVEFAHAVLGSVMAGWAILMIVVVAGPFRRRERWAWWAVTASLVLWFVVDTAASLGTGFWQNAVLNAVLAAGFVPGLVGTRPGQASIAP